MEDKNNAQLQLPLEEEPKVMFNSLSDLRELVISNEEGTEELVKISGYDLHIKFALKYLKSLEDVEAAVSGISDLFRKLILEQLLPSESTNAQ